MKEEKKQKKEDKMENGAISRKEAIRKTGYVALSAATMMLLLGKPNKAVAASPRAPRPWAE